MSLFKWSTPERRVRDRNLPIIPNEIYLEILEHVAPANERPLPEELDTLTNLSLVCRFFANFCLPRIFEYVKLSGAIFRDDASLSLRNDGFYKTPRGSTLCEQIAAKQPLALSLAQCVKFCHFTCWKLNDTASWAVRIFAQKYLAGMTCMKNIRQLKFSLSLVDMDHWRAIATLQSLEKLCFDKCHFLRGPADLEPEKRIKVKARHLQVIDCEDDRQAAAAIDTRFLHVITTDSTPFRSLDWSPQSPFKELRLRYIPDGETIATGAFVAVWLDYVLKEVPQCIEALSIPVHVQEELPQRLFAIPSWKNVPRLRSLSIEFRFSTPEAAPELEEVVSYVLEGIRVVISLQTLTVTDNLTRAISPTVIRDILNEKIGRRSNLQHVDMCGRVFRLVDGRWTEAPCNTT